MDTLPPSGNSFWDPWWSRTRDNPYAFIISAFHYRLYNGWTKLCGHSAANANSRYDNDAASPDSMGDIYCDSTSTFSISSVVSSHCNDVV